MVDVLGGGVNVCEKCVCVREPNSTRLSIINNQQSNHINTDGEEIYDECRREVCRCK